MSFCSNCGNRLGEGSKFCASCGASVGSNMQAPTSNIQQPPMGNMQQPPMGNMQQAPMGNMQGYPMGGMPQMPAGNMQGYPMGGMPGYPMGGMQQAPVGMRTVEEVSEFYRSTLKMKDGYVNKYRKGIEKLVHSLAPNEVIEFASHGVVGGLRDGSQAELACTNMRFIIAGTPSGMTSVNRALHGRGSANAVISVRYDMITGVDVKNGLMIGTIEVSTISGDTYTINVDKPWTDIVYQGINNSVLQHAYR